MPLALFSSSVESHVPLEEAPDVITALILGRTEQAHFSSEAQGV